MISCTEPSPESCLFYQPRFTQAEMTEDIAVTNFRRYLRINSEQPTPDYNSCKEFLFGLADELGYEKSAYECAPGKPFIILTLRGTNEALSSLMLYSHTDVVPTFKDQWKHDPYEAFKDSDGKIFGRGAQDMKSVGIQYIEALRRLHKKGTARFLRSVHLVYGPDEEIGGTDGMEKFVNTDVFKKLNVGFALDEGLADEGDAFKVFYAERCPWWLVISCKGQPGHGSRFIQDTAAEKLQKVINNFLTFREEQRKKLESNSQMKLGDVITVNLTKIEGGVQINVVPSELKAYFDIRLPPTADFEAFEGQIQKFCKNAGPDVSYSFIRQSKIKNMTPVTSDDPWWKAFSSVFEEEKCEISKETFSGTTDSRFLREKGYRSIGFSPMNRTRVLLHDHDEYLEESVFLRGVEIYEKLISRLANLPAF